MQRILEMLRPTFGRLNVFFRMGYGGCLSLEEREQHLQPSGIDAIFQFNCGPAGKDDLELAGQGPIENVECRITQAPS